MSKELKHTLDFLNQKVGKKAGFSTPKNYFNEVEENLATSIFTNSLPKESAFTTPTNYFDTLDDALLSKLNTKEVKVITLRKRVLQYIPIAAAASVLLFIGINYFNSQKITFEDITIADIESWYEEGYAEPDTEALTMALNTSDLEEDLFSSISSESLEDYLITIDAPLLLNETE